MDQPRTSVANSGDVVRAGPDATQWDGDRLRALAEIYLRAVAIGAYANELAQLRRWTFRSCGSAIAHHDIIDFSSLGSSQTLARLA